MDPSSHPFVPPPHQHTRSGSSGSASSASASPQIRPIPSGIPPHHMVSPTHTLQSSLHPHVYHRPRVHIIYDYGTLPCPAQVQLDRMLTMIQNFASTYGEVVSFTLPILTSNSALDAHMKQVCRDHGVQLEEIAPNDPSSETFLLTRLLRLTLELQQSAAISATPAMRTSVIILSNHSSLTSSIALLRQSSLFAHIVLIHGADASQELRSSANATLSLPEFLAGVHPKSQEERPASSMPTPSPPGFTALRRPSSLATSPVDEATTGVSLLGMHPQQQQQQQPLPQQQPPPTPHGSSQLGTSPRHSPLAGLSLAASPSQGLLPTPQGGSPSMRFFGTPHGTGLTMPLHSPSPSSKYKGKLASSAPSSPTHRSFFPSSAHSPSSLTHTGGLFHARSGSDRHQSFHSAAATSARTRACLQAYSRIIAYCESEKLIPRESVLKKRLVDSKLQLTEAGGGGVEFEEFLATVVASGVGIMEGEAPQRIVWPRGPDGTARHFPCADFFTPVSRLSPEQNAELLEFLYAVQPEVERGRFGFANWLAAHGPPFVRLLAHGVLVELVQLLLNRKVLLFRKGRVSVASRSEANEAASLGMLFNATDFQTPAVSRGGSPAISRVNSPTPADTTIWDPKGSAEDVMWRSNAVAPSASHIDRTLLHGKATGGISQLSSPLYSSSSYHSSTGSFSLPVSRATSPTRGSLNTPPSQQDILRMRGGDVVGSKPTTALQPISKQLLHSTSEARSIFDPTVAASFDAHLQPMHQEEEFGGAKGLWMKEERPGSNVPSTFSSRRNSLTETDSWRATAGATSAAPFESSTGFIGESMDACDPAAVLTVKLARLNSDHIAASSAGAAGDELARFTAAVQYRPCFHFEKSGAAHTPEWVCLVAFSIGTKRYQMRSGIHSKKDLAKNEVCMKVLQMLEDESIAMAPHSDAAREPDVVDSVVDLARLLNFLQQAPVVYYLTRVQPMSRFDSRGRRNSGGSIGLSGHAMWNGSTRIQVKSVNVLTGEAQPTVSASTPFTHSVTAASKNEAKELIAANLLQQIQRARVVNPALFTVLSAARQNLVAVPSRPQEDTIFHQSGTAPPPAPIGAPVSTGSSAAPPPVDMSRMSSASLFSMHTPVAGRAFSGISAIGLATPGTATTQREAFEATLGHHAYSTLDQVAEDSDVLTDESDHVHTIARPHIITRSTSEVMNEEAEQTSAELAEKALQETPKGAHH